MMSRLTYHLASATSSSEEEIYAALREHFDAQ
jgi:hypothetical protein